MNALLQRINTPLPLDAKTSLSSQLDQALADREHYEALASYHSGQALICRFLSFQAGLRLSKLQRQIPLQYRRAEGAGR